MKKREPGFSAEGGNTEEGPRPSAIHAYKGLLRRQRFSPRLPKKGGKGDTSVRAETGLHFTF